MPPIRKNTFGQILKYSRDSNKIMAIRRIDWKGGDVFLFPPFLRVFPFPLFEDDGFIAVVAK